MRIKHAVFTIILGLSLAACQINNPITTTQDWLELIQQKQFVEASNTMVVAQHNTFTSLSEKQQVEFSAYVSQTYPDISQINVNNMLPLSQEELQSMEVEQGYDVFFSLQLPDGTIAHQQVKVVWWQKGWKIILQIPFH